MNAPVYLLLVAAGIAVMAWALPAAHRYRPPYDSMAAVAVLAGLLMSVAGVILTILPRFFQE